LSFIGKLPQEKKEITGQAAEKRFASTYPASRFFTAAKRLEGHPEYGGTPSRMLSHQWLFAKIVRRAFLRR
jgi:hypothetical protein